MVNLTRKVTESLCKMQEKNSRSIPMVSRKGKRKCWGSCHKKGPRKTCSKTAHEQRGTHGLVIEPLREPVDWVKKGLETEGGVQQNRGRVPKTGCDQLLSQKGRDSVKGPRVGKKPPSAVVIGGGKKKKTPVVGILFPCSHVLVDSNNFVGGLRQGRTPKTAPLDSLSHTIEKKGGKKGGEDKIFL